jgi:hypothetical protein
VTDVEQDAGTAFGDLPRVLALLFLVRSLIVRHELGEGGSHTTLRSVNNLRERRGF